jgi:hypothetical protein
MTPHACFLVSVVHQRPPFHYRVCRLSNKIGISENQQVYLGELKRFAVLGAPFISPAQKAACVETFIEMLRILHESEENHFEAIATGDESWFQYCYRP